MKRDVASRAFLKREAQMSIERFPTRTSPRIMRPKEVCEVRGTSRVQLWRDVKAGKFPPPIELGPNSIGWWDSVVYESIESSPRRTYDAEIPET